MFPIERRLVLKCTVGGFIGLLRDLPAVADVSAQNGGQRPSRINWDQFVGKISELAELRSRGALTSASFVQNAADVGSILNLEDKSLLGGSSFLHNRQVETHSPFMLAEINRHITFEIMLLSLETGYSIPLHDHPRCSGVSLCIAGRARVVNYDLDDSQAIVRLRARAESTIGPSKAGTLTEHEGNIHAITAVKHTQIVDVFCPPLPAVGGFHVYRAEPESVDGTILRVTSIS